MLAPHSGYATSKRGNPPVLTACAAFAPDGSAAAATTDTTTLSLEITEPLGKVEHMHLGLHFSVPSWQLENQSMRTRLYRCQVFFNSASNLVVVCVAPGGFPAFQDHLQIAVADLRSLKWVGDFTVGPQPGFVPLALAGFFERTNRLVVTGGPPGHAVTGIQNSLFASLLVDPSGKELVAIPAIRAGLGRSHGAPGTFYADAVHNRLWGFPCELYSAPYSKQPLCPALSTTLIGEQAPISQFNPGGYTNKRTDLWMAPGVFAATDADTILIAENSLGVDTIWRVDIKKKTLDRFVLPKRRHYPRFEEIHGQASVSPDGQVLAVPLLQYTLAFPYLVDNYVVKGTDIAVVDLHPFQLLGFLPHGRSRYTPAFAVDHRQGKATILVYRQDHWERQEWNCPPGS